MQIVKNDPRLHQGALDAKTGKRAVKPQSVQARWTFLRRRALSTRQSREKGCVIRKSRHEHPVTISAIIEARSRPDAPRRQYEMIEPCRHAGDFDT